MGLSCNREPHAKIFIGRLRHPRAEVIVQMQAGSGTHQTGGWIETTRAADLAPWSKCSSSVVVALCNASVARGGRQGRQHRAFCSAIEAGVKKETALDGHVDNTIA